MASGASICRNTEPLRSVEPRRVASRRVASCFARVCYIGGMIRYPAARKDEIVETIFGKRIADPYRWLEDEHSAEVQAWMTAQDTSARAALAAYPKRDELAERMKQLLYYDAVSAPIHRKGRYFYTRKHVDREKTIVYWKQGEDGEQRVLFDPNQWSVDGSKGLHGWWPTHDGASVAYTISEHNSDETVMHVLDVASGDDLPDVIAGTKYAAASWTPDGSGFYYTWVPPIGGDVTVAERPGFAEVRFHRLGSDPAGDAIIHPATHDPQTFIGGGISRDGHWLTAVIQHGWNSSEILFKDARTPDATWTTLVTGIDAIFDLTIWRDRFYVMTNDGAPRYRLFAVEPHQPERAAWREIVTESEATLESVSVVGEHLVLVYLRHAANEIALHALDGKHVRQIALPPLGTTGGVSGNPDEDTGYIGYTSFTEPQVIYKASIHSGEVAEHTRITLPIDTTQLVTEQVFYPSRDGTQISMFLVHHKDARRDGTNPTVLNGYGGFSVNMTPGFASSRALWLERGGVIAIPNLRGGGEYGEDWHKAGMLLAKQNVFDDAIAAAEYLIAQRWTSPAHLAISGGSNGGLLVGAVMAQRPELFKAVVCAVPLLDMLRYHLSGSGRTWVPEYGSADNPEQFAAIYAYSPYRCVVDHGKARYPAVLFDSADHDDRVDPLHARKLAAALQDVQTAHAPILLRIERNSGHGGADMVKSQVERVADQYAFLLAHLR